mmetsp:Transcript_32262/g.92890  ORF Transcript_32262/g.92890 Transcript_32262/m.92890 type:complete len:238 (-) Transcript_32262:1033-1746(-)
MSACRACCFIASESAKTCLRDRRVCSLSIETLTLPRERNDIPLCPGVLSDPRLFRRCRFSNVFGTGSKMGSVWHQSSTVPSSSVCVKKVRTRFRRTPETNSPHRSAPAAVSESGIGTPGTMAVISPLPVKMQGLGANAFSFVFPRIVRRCGLKSAGLRKSTCIASWILPTSRNKREDSSRNVCKVLSTATSILPRSVCEGFSWSCALRSAISPGSKLSRAMAISLLNNSVRSSSSFK